MELTNLETLEVVSRNAEIPFSGTRQAVADFFAAEKVLSELFGELGLKRGGVFRRPIEMVMHQLEKVEGGLSEIEKRALRDLGNIMGARKVVIATGETSLSKEETLGTLRRSDN